MFCPVCGQQQVSEETRFCSRCGFPLTNVASVITNGGAAPQLSSAETKSNELTPRKRGLKQGLFIFLLTFLVVPIVAILTIWANAEPFMVAISAITLFVGGLLRMAYALLFESSEPHGKTLEENVLTTAQNVLGKRQSANALPPQQSIPVETYAPPKQGNWRDTNDLNTTTSVTEHTTKFLDNK
jgi:hypothetical protein